MLFGKYWNQLVTEIIGVIINVNYCQCTLKKGKSNEVVWIPEKYAKKGKWLKIVNDNGWQVMETGNPLSEEYVFGHERDFKKQRKASDI